MRVNPKLRAALLVGALALTLAAVRWADKLTDMNEASAGAVAEATPRARANPAPTPATGQQAPTLDLGKLRRAPVVDPNGDPFGPRSFQPPPPKAKVAAATAMAAAAPPQPPPQAPPLPFAYIGRLSEDRDTTVFLAMGERNLVLKPGDVIDNTYKLEEVNDSGVVLTYLPLSQRQTLSIGTP
jgi:hypothetical protein